MASRSASVMNRLLLLLVVSLVGVGCDGIPKDPDGTLDRVRAQREYRVGLIAGPALGASRQQLFLSMVSEAAGARPRIQTDAAEPLLAQLEAGELDLVIGAMTPHSPWSKHVSFLPPLGEQVTAAEHLHLVAMAKNGENRWISLLHNAAIKARAQP